MFPMPPRTGPRTTEEKGKEEGLEEKRGWRGGCNVLDLRQEAQTRACVRACSKYRSFFCFYTRNLYLFAYYAAVHEARREAAGRARIFLGRGGGKRNNLNLGFLLGCLMRTGPDAPLLVE